LQLERIGRGEAYLLWRFSEMHQERTYDGLSEQLSGAFGELMSRAGIESALVAPNGIVLTTTPGLAERATGSRDNSLAGLEFVQLLRSDDR
ncbi:MAG TPA: hybrid sensor histidine kinase/response regulator, partial [Erythrobacter sp.]|nr:hybrid sensor histidine kinase/response regulator [Erythrobacter sp.]